MPVKHLTPTPNLNHLKFQAKDLLTAHAVREPGAAQRIREFHPRFHRATDAEIFAACLRVSDAQLAIAREYGFQTWTRLKRHIEKPTAADDLELPQHERIEDPLFRRAVDLLDRGDVIGLTELLNKHSELVRQHVSFEGGNYFRNPTLLEFVAENPIRRGRLPNNIVQVAEVILNAGAAQDQAALNEALGLVCSGRVPRECSVQVPLINLLCEHGADPDKAMSAALVHGEFEAADALIRRDAQVDLRVAAAQGRLDTARQALPSANPDERQQALALASQFGRIEIVQLLLDAGEDPSRYNPLGFHSHSTPLHQAAWAGHDELVRVLVERGARLDLKDTLWQGTPAEWAKHAGNAKIEEYLLAQEARKQPTTT